MAFCFAAQCDGPFANTHLPGFIITTPHDSNSSAVGPKKLEVTYCGMRQYNFNACILSCLISLDNPLKFLHDYWYCDRKFFHKRFMSRWIRESIETFCGESFSVEHNIARDGPSAGILVVTLDPDYERRCEIVWIVCLDSHDDG